jgi:hypothetical protein
MKTTRGKKSEYILGNLMIDPPEKTHYFSAVRQFDPSFAGTGFRLSIKLVPVWKRTVFSPVRKTAEETRLQPPRKPLDLATF